MNFEVGQVYIIAETGRFFCIHEIHDDYVTIGNLCEYYNDSRTNLMRNPVSYEFVESAVKVVALDQIPGAFHDGIGWRHQMTVRR